MLLRQKIEIINFIIKGISWILFIRAHTTPQYHRGVASISSIITRLLRLIQDINQRSNGNDWFNYSYLNYFFELPPDFDFLKKF